MKLFKMILSLIIVSILLLYNVKLTTYAKSNTPTNKPIKVAVLLPSLDNEFFYEVKRNLEIIEKENKNKIEFSFF